MSKTKKIKQKTTGFDIVYRIVTAIMTILIYPLFWFLNLIYIQVDHTGIADIFNMLGGEDVQSNLSVTYEYLSIPEILDVLNLASGLSDESSFNLWSNYAYRPLIIAIIFLAITLVLGVVILGFAAFSNKVKVITGLSAAGFVSALVSFFVFSEGFAAPITSGEVSLSQLFGQGDNSFLELIFGIVGEVTFLSLDSAFFSVLFLMLGILVWSLSVLIVNNGEQKEKAMKEAARKHR